MQTLRRDAAQEIGALMGHFPAVVLTGPRQCGKTTLAQQWVAASEGKSLYLDLGKPADSRLRAPLAATH